MQRPSDINPFRGWTQADALLLGGAALGAWAILRPRRIVGDIVGGAADFAGRAVNEGVIQPGQRAIERVTETARSQTASQGSTDLHRAADLGDTYVEANRTPLYQALHAGLERGRGVLSPTDWNWVKSVKERVLDNAGSWLSDARVASNGNLLEAAETRRLRTLGNGMADFASQARTAAMRGMHGDPIVLPPVTFGGECEDAKGQVVPCDRAGLVFAAPPTKPASATRRRRSLGPLAFLAIAAAGAVASSLSRE